MKIGQGANKKNLCLAKSHFFFSVLKIGGQLKQKLIMYFVYHKREDPFNQFKGCVLHYSCIRSACGVRPHPQNDSEYQEKRSEREKKRAKRVATPNGGEKS